MIKSMLAAVDDSTQATEAYFSRLLIPYEVHYLRRDSHATILHRASEKAAICWLWAHSPIAYLTR
jgi:hypothetical protein